MVYDRNNPGLALTTADLSNPIHTNNFRGFLSKSDLFALIDQPNCVGIRVYGSAIESVQNPTERILAVGVRENGTEKDGRGLIGYILSPVFNPNQVTNGARIEDRDVARSMVTDVLEFNSQIEARVTSFFSTLAIERLLDDKDGVPVEGIGFYHFRSETNEFSHNAASFVKSPGLQRIVSNPAFSHIQSTLACPGNCVVLATTGALLTSTVETILNPNGRTEGIYLKRWDR